MNHSSSRPPSRSSASRGRSRTSALLVLALAVVGALVVVGCEQDLISDGNFRLWCFDVTTKKETLCAWRLDEGAVGRAPTWHKDDHGVELLDTPTTISQELRGLSSCSRFSAIVDVQPGADVVMAIDFTGLGQPEFGRAITGVGFREYTAALGAVPVSNIPPRIYIKKRGVGRAVLAQVRVVAESPCSVPPARLRGRRLGDRCTHGPVLGDSGECASGVCCEGVCAECCVSPKLPDFGADGAIVTPPQVACADGGVCQRRDAPYNHFLPDAGAVPNGSQSTLFASAPLQCDPGRRVRAAGQACLADDDCASSDCVGATSAATGGSDTVPCSPDFPDAGSPSCSFIHVLEGRCH